MKCAEQMRENLVIGGGLAGAMAGLRLAAAGRDVVLIEKERAAHHKVCGEFLSPEAVEYLRQAEVDPLRLGAAAIERLRFFAGNQVIQTRLPFSALSLSRQVLDQALLARAVEAGCDVRTGVAVQRLSRNEDVAIAQLVDGTASGARHVFLATGKHDLRGWNRSAGTHGDLVGFKMHWRLQPEQTNALRGFMELYLFKGGYGGLALVENDTANLCLVIRRSRLQRLGGWRGILAVLTEDDPPLAQRLSGAERLWETPLAISSIPYGYIADGEDGIWRLGDQAAVIPSFSGDGMAIALHSGAMAAEMCLAGKPPRQYHAELKKQLQRGVTVATLLSRAMCSRAGRQLAPVVIPLLPRPIGWIARLTRIPQAALHPSFSR